MRPSRSGGTTSRRPPKQAHEDHGDGRSGCHRDHARQRGAQQDGRRDEAAAGPARVSVVLEHPVLRLRLLRSGGICRRRAPFVGVSHRIVRIRNAVNGGFDYHVHIAGLPLVSKGRWRRFWQAPSSWFACPPCVPRVFRFPTGHRVFFFRFQLWSAGRRNRTDGRVLGCREKEARRRERSRPTVSGIVAVPWSLRLCRSGQVFSFRQAAVSSRFAAIRSRADSWAETSWSACV